MNSRKRPRRRVTAATLLALLVAVLAVGLSQTGAIPGLVADGKEQGPVVRVVDGDTIHVHLRGREQTVRYIGVDTPESVDPRRPVERLGREASQRNHQLVEGKMVTLEKDVSETDRFGRLLRYVYIDGRMVNATLVEEGFANASAFPPDVKYRDLFARLEREARAAKRGLWGSE
ncbi:MAG: hypothetical protein EXR51_10200 [Dehalococcoidia bacterium]|nr:hypothetical protein [Dehalococcoidia bacterium]